MSILIFHLIGIIMLTENFVQFTGNTMYMKHYAPGCKTCKTLVGIETEIRFYKSALRPAAKMSTFKKYFTGHGKPIWDMMHKTTCNTSAVLCSFWNTTRAVWCLHWNTTRAVWCLHHSGHIGAPPHFYIYSNSNCGLGVTFSPTYSRLSGIKSLCRSQQSQKSRARYIRDWIQH